MHDWQSLTPVYAPELSGASLMAQGEVFWIGDGRLCSEDRLPPHWHDTYEMGFIHSGTGVIVLGEEEYAYQPGQVYIVNDLEPHMGYTNTPCTELFVVHFHPALLDENWITQICTEAHVPFIPNFSPSGPLIPLEDEVTVPIRHILEQIRQEAKLRNSAWEIVVSGLILQAVGNLARRLLNNTDITLQDMKRRYALKQIRPVLHMIEQRYVEPLSLNEIAREAHISRSHCCALFQTALNTTPIAYRNSRRLTEARRLLQNTNLTVREIAYQVGFGSVQQFNRLFLRETNMSPTKFRQRLFEAD